jgi:hypothetical protein
MSLFWAGVTTVQDGFGKAEYISRCTALGQIPVTQVIKCLQLDSLDLDHYGIGDKGMEALYAALLVCVLLVLAVACFLQVTTQTTAAVAEYRSIPLFGSYA